LIIAGKIIGYDLAGSINRSVYICLCSGATLDYNKKNEYT
jgi:hypothetical protein